MLSIMLFFEVKGVGSAGSDLKNMIAGDTFNPGVLGRVP
jgi:hypothetical protein